MVSRSKPFRTSKRLHKRRRKSVSMACRAPDRLHIFCLCASFLSYSDVDAGCAFCRVMCEVSFVKVYSWTLTLFHFRSLGAQHNELSRCSYRKSCSTDRELWCASVLAVSSAWSPACSFLLWSLKGYTWLRLYVLSLVQFAHRGVWQRAVGRMLRVDNELYNWPCPKR